MLEGFEVGHAVLRGLVLLVITHILVDSATLRQVGALELLGEQLVLREPVYTPVRWVGATHGAWLLALDGFLWSLDVIILANALETEEVVASGALPGLEHHFETDHACEVVVLLARL